MYVNYLEPAELEVSREVGFLYICPLCEVSIKDQQKNDADPELGVLESTTDDGQKVEWLVHEGCIHAHNKARDRGEREDFKMPALPDHVDIAWVMM